MKLQTPIQRGETQIDDVEIRQPAAGELRGVSLVDPPQMDVGPLITVLPRITTPSLTAQEVAALDPADMLSMGGKVTGFLLPKAALSPSA
jgi:hypothetical protein